MAVTAKVLINAKYAANAQQTEYTAPASTRTIIDKFTATNTDASAQTISIHIIPSGGSYGGSNKIVKTLSITAAETKDITQMQNQILAAGDIVNVEVSLSSAVIIRMSGRECT
ncbi:MAG: hypothetical protein IPJ84_18875 [Bdellovibrionales bacterium]|nr:hypothetical protein [Bdellovibrionales bacterium]